MMYVHRKVFFRVEGRIKKSVTFVQIWEERGGSGEFFFAE